ncbi:hypothetical protein DRQ26_05215 [bacterium]|nr:MAG: hypothetical protein DRQ26_05215 [bacterium]
MKKIIILVLAALILVFTGSAVLAETQSDANADATAHVEYAPSTYYEGSVFTRHHVNNQSYTHHMETIQPAGVEGWKLYWNFNLAKAFLFYNWEDAGKPEGWSEQNWISVNPPNNIAPIWLEKEPIGSDVVFMGDVTFRARDRASAKTAIFNALHHAKYTGGAIYYTVKIKSTYKGVGQGMSVGQGTTIGTVLSGGKQPDNAMLTLGMGGMLGKTSSWMEAVPDALISIYSSPGEKMPEWYLSLMNPEKQETKPDPDLHVFDHAPEVGFLVEPIFFDFDKSGIRIDQEEKLFRIASWIKANQNFLIQNNLKVHFVGYCDLRGSEKYNNTLGMDRGKAGKMATENICLFLDMAIEKTKKIFVAVSGSEINKDNPDVFFPDHDLNRRLDVIIASNLTTIPQPEIKTPAKQEGDKK